MNDFSDEHLIKWSPFVGNKFLNEDYKILVVGESHYGIPSDLNDLSHNPDFTKLMVKELGIEQMNYGNIKLFNRINNLLQYTSENDVWNKISFYNFIQRVMPENTVRPSREDYIIGWKAFLSIVNELKPDLCVFIGVEAEKTFQMSVSPISNVKIENLSVGEKINGTYCRTAILNYNDSSSKVIFVKHLSKYATIAKWRDKIFEFSPEARSIFG